MRNLLRKELTLCTNPQVIIFCLFSCLVAIPSWPSVVAFVYVFSGIATIFPRALADQDLQYTAMLPIRKGDVVKGKTALISVLELSSLIFSIPFALIKIYLADPQTIAGDPAGEVYTLAVEPTMSVYGFVFLAFGVYNAVMLPWYYRNPAKVNWPLLWSMLIGFLVLGLGAGAKALIYFKLGGDTGSLTYYLVEGGVLLAGFIFFVFLTIFGEKRAEKKFDKVDL